MNTVNSTASIWNIITGQKTSNEEADGSFAALFGASMKNASSNTSSIADMLAQLTERFQGTKVNITDGTSNNTETSEDKEGDNVNVTSDALASMASNNDLASKIQEAIAAFFDSAAGSNNSIPNSYSQRNVSVTVTTISFKISTRSESTGETLSSQELQAALQDKLKELINNFFGGKGVDETEDDEDGADTKTEETNNQYNNLFPSGNWSMQLFYSSTFMQSMGSNGNSAMSSQSFNFSASFNSTSSNFQDFATSFLPQSMFGQNGSNGMFNNSSFYSMLEGGLGQLGLTSGGFSQTTDGFMLSLRNGRDFLSELLGLTGLGKTSAAIEPPAEETVGAATEASEVAAV